MVMRLMAEPGVYKITLNYPNPFLAVYTAEYTNVAAHNRATANNFLENYLQHERGYLLRMTLIDCELRYVRRT